MEQEEESRGVSWGMTDDVEEFPDMEQVGYRFLKTL
jgi:hypothetical protein